eukprot:TRINITY_DN2149_c0_g1_i1.p1 TRINITY_DN2149_c0_g1~~TRINITY_DN2149_c0_g1_i1.p1  ORF type:complete len:338 (-),score=83.28 TRINITY_DN2149_c0_g1_i1:27-1040(-)
MQATLTVGQYGYVQPVSTQTTMGAWGGYGGMAPELQGYPTCDPNVDADSLKSAFKGIGTDEKTVIKILCNRSKEQLAQISLAYQQRHKHTLIHDICDEVSFNFQKLLVSLCTPRDQMRANHLTVATKGLGTNERFLIDVFAHATNAEIFELQSRFPQAIEGVVGDVSFGNFAKAIKALLKGARDENPYVDDVRAQQVADQLYAAGEGKLGTDDSVFVDVFTKYSSWFLQRVNFFYQQKYKHDLVTAVKKETSGNYKSLLVALAKPKLVFYADRLYKAMHGAGTDDAGLIYCMSILNKAELKEVARIFGERRKGKTLAAMIKGDTSGHYEEALLALLQ